MSRPRRHHYIPRLLLNRFASRREDRKYWIWQLARNREPREVSTRDIAVASGFYGQADTGVEEAFAVEEGSFGRILRGLQTGRAPNELYDDLRWLVWTLGVRTRALREQFLDAANRILDKVIDTVNTEQARASVLEHAEEPFFQAVRAQLSELPTEQRVHAERFLRTRSTKEALRKLLAKSVSSMDLAPFAEVLVSKCGFR
jgi:hypothetical protein